MFAKPINLLLVYIVTVFNLAILASPLLAALVLFVDRHHLTLHLPPNLLVKLKLAIFILLFLVSFLMLGYFLLDILFGFAMRSSLKGCTRYDTIKDYDFLQKIFIQAQEKFHEPNVKLYIKNSDEINAFAVSSLGGKAVVLTRGIIDHYLAKSENPEEFLLALRSIIGHEMSHLINKDFLPTFLIIANQRVTNFVSYILDIIFVVITRITALIPYGGRASTRLMNQIYYLINFAINFFNHFIVFNIYEFLRRFISRTIEYRCDLQSAQAFGGKNMARALSFLGESGYFTLFSTHPNTKKRIMRVQNILEAEDTKIKPSLIDSISNYCAIMLPIIISLYLAKQAQIDLLIREYAQNHEAINRKLNLLWQLIHKFL